MKFPLSEDGVMELIILLNRLHEHEAERLSEANLIGDDYVMWEADKILNSIKAIGSALYAYLENGNFKNSEV